MKQINIGLVVVILLLITLGACQEQKTGETSTPSVQQTPSDDSWRQQLSGKITFQSDRNGNWDIYAMNVDGSNLVQLTDNPADDGYPVWSPDGTKIVFESKRDGPYAIYLMNADGSDQTRLTNHPSNNFNPEWSPDGKKIVFSSDRNGKNEVYIMNVDGSEVVQVTKTNVPRGENGIAAWSPDGKRLAFTGKRWFGWDVYVMTLDQPGEQKLTDGHGACRPDWSPDGKKIAYVSQAADGKGDIWVMNPDGSEKTRVTTDDHNYDYYPAWSPDGKYIAYAKTDDKTKGNWELYVISADGKENVRLTNHPARDTFPDWATGSVPDELVMRQKFVYEAESLPHQIGTPQQDADAIGGQAIFASPKDQLGFVVYGPYKSYPPADYVASFRLKTDNIKLQEPLVTIDVVTNAGQTVLAKRDLQGSDFSQKNQYQEFQLPFALAESKTLEFRVYALAKATIAVDQIAVTIKASK
jgi:TolB protein